ncbi:MAG: hypothetical protein GXY38_10620 [Planctomycetes bacterium]|nr:hypothetical protein [Planctomycetota bacterium]
MLERKKLLDSVRLACDWLANTAQTKTHELPPRTGNPGKYPYSSWRGAMRTEYRVADKHWWYYGVIWHTGQAVKALVTAADALGDETYLQAAAMGADFILANQVWDRANPDHGLILAYEDYPDTVNTSAIMECMHGLMLLADRIGSRQIWDRVIAAGQVLINKHYMPQHGLFRDIYDPAKHEFVVPNPFRTKNDIGGRPLVEDSVLLRLFEKTGDKRFFDAHVRVSETLVADENPPGNWIDYSPCNSERGVFHPRHNFWWGLPLIETYRATGKQVFLETAIAAGRFSENVMRADGGWIRRFFTNNKTESFDHATSGSACAAILWLNLFRETGDRHWLDLAEQALSYCQRMQFTHAKDENLHGAILEKVVPPDGSDDSPYHIRDIGTIFFVIASLSFLNCTNEV